MLTLFFFVFIAMQNNDLETAIVLCIDATATLSLSLWNILSFLSAEKYLMRVQKVEYFEEVIPERCSRYIDCHFHWFLIPICYISCKRNQVIQALRITNRPVIIRSEYDDSLYINEHGATFSTSRLQPRSGYLLSIAFGNLSQNRNLRSMTATLMKHFKKDDASCR